MIEEIPDDDGFPADLPEPALEALMKSLGAPPEPSASELSEMEPPDD